MLAYLAPAKMLDFTATAQASALSATAPRLIAKADALAALLAGHSKAQLKATLGVSDSIAATNHQRYQDYKAGGKAGKQALLSYSGMAFQALDAASMSPDDLDYAQRHLRVLDGLYGVLRPLDRIQPYRLEMQQKLAPPKPAKGTLYDFWKPAIAEVLSRDLVDASAAAGAGAGAGAGGAAPVLVNIASAEYSKAVDTGALPEGTRVIECVFKGCPVKRARGLMARYLVVNRVNDVEGLKGFDTDGFRFNERSSSDSKFVFERGAGGGGASGGGGGGRKPAKGKGAAAATKAKAGGGGGGGVARGRDGTAAAAANTDGPGAPRAGASRGGTTAGVKRKAQAGGSTKKPAQRARSASPRSRR